MDEQILSDKKKRGRPSKGNDNRVTIRLSDEQMEKLCKIGRDYYIYSPASQGQALSVSISDVIRKLIDEYPAFHDSMIEFMTDTLISVADRLNAESDVLRINGEDDAAHDDALDANSLIYVAYLINNGLSYEDNCPDVTKKRYEFVRHAKLINKRKKVYWDDFNKITVKKQERKRNPRFIYNFVRQK